MGAISTFAQRRSFEAAAPGPGQPITQMDADLVVGVFSASRTGDDGYLMVVDSRVATGQGSTAILHSVLCCRYLDLWCKIEWDGTK